MLRALIILILTTLTLASWAQTTASSPSSLPGSYQIWLEADQDKKNQMIELFNERQDLLFANLAIDCHKRIPVRLSLIESSVTDSRELVDVARGLQRRLGADQATANVVGDDLHSLKDILHFTNRVISHNRCAISQEPTLGAACSANFSGHERRPFDFGERSRISRRMRFIENERMPRDRAIRIIDDFFYWQSFTVCMYMPQIESLYEIWENDSLSEREFDEEVREAFSESSWKNPFF